MLSLLRKSVVFGGAALLSLGSLSAQVVINEVYYDAPGSDNGQVFVELYGPPGTDIGGWVIQAIEGSGSSASNCNNESFTFPAGTTIGASGFVVVADDDGSGSTSVANANFIVSDMDLENSNEGLQLVDTSGATPVLVDAMAYGTIDPTNVASGCNGLGWFEGNPARDVFAPHSLERSPAGNDTGDNDTDFFANNPTPGAGATCTTAMAYLNLGVRNNLTIANGDAVGIEFWTSCASNGLYLVLASFVDPATTPPPAGIPVWGPLTGTMASMVNVPPFVAWGGTVPANGRVLGTATLDWSAFTGLPTLPAPTPMYVGAIAFDSGFNLTSTNTITITLN